MYHCSEEDKLTYSSPSQIHCVSKCSMEKRCLMVNYLPRNLKLQNNCEVFVSETPKQSCYVVDTTEDWIAMRFKRENEIVKKEEEERVYASCKEIFESEVKTTDGVYQLTSGKHYCAMSSVGECGGGGWTLAMKVNGSKSTFHASSLYWQNSLEYRVDEALSDPDNEEAKYPAFSKMGFQSICIGMTYESATNWILINKAGSSLLDIFKHGRPVSTSLGPDKWKSIMKASCLQPDCNNEGFNSGKHNGEIYVRVGIASNTKTGEGNKCNRIQSFLGIGTRVLPSGSCSARRPCISCGNFSCLERSCRRSVAGIGTILIR